MVGDVHLFNQIFNNLISNSICHGFEGYNEGEVEISVEAITDGIAIEYRDNGKGISSENINNIFVPFFYD